MLGLHNTVKTLTTDISSRWCDHYHASPLLWTDNNSAGATIISSKQQQQHTQQQQQQQRQQRLLCRARREGYCFAGRVYIATALTLWMFLVKIPKAGLGIQLSWVQYAKVRWMMGTARADIQTGPPIFRKPLKHAYGRCCNPWNMHRVDVVTPGTRTEQMLKSKPKLQHIYYQCMCARRDMHRADDEPLPILLHMWYQCMHSPAACYTQQHEVHRQTLWCDCTQCSKCTISDL